MGYQSTPVEGKDLSLEKRLSVFQPKGWTQVLKEAPMGPHGNPGKDLGIHMLKPYSHPRNWQAELASAAVEQGMGG